MDTLKAKNAPIKKYPFYSQRYIQKTIIIFYNYTSV
mgnify:CR=1 FL=1